MTEFEAATLALQRTRLWAAIAIPIVTAVIGLLQTGVVVYGIRAIIRANEGRVEADVARAEADVARADAEAARHVETMARLDQQAEALRVLDRTYGGPGAARTRIGELPTKGTRDD